MYLVSPSAETRAISSVRSRGNSIVLNIFYAPDILVFGSADSVRDADVRY